MYPSKYSMIFLCVWDVIYLFSVWFFGTSSELINVDFGSIFSQINGYSNFLPLVVRYVFGISASTASYAVGFVLIPGAAGGRRRRMFLV